MTNFLKDLFAFIKGETEKVANCTNCKKRIDLDKIKTKEQELEYLSYGLCVDCQEILFNRKKENE